MGRLNTRRSGLFRFLFLIPILAFSSCGDGGTGTDGDQTGATLEGRIVLFNPVPAKEAGQIFPPGVGEELPVAFDPVSGVTVKIGNKSAKTDGGGSFRLRNIPLDDHPVTFQSSGNTAVYSLNDVEVGTTILLDQIQINGNQVKTKHTGTWVGTAGSTDPGSAGQIAFVLTIQANGNVLTGSGELAPPDSSIWSMSGTENGTGVKGVMTLVSSKSECATGADFIGTFSADTLSGTFVEVNPPAQCGSPESGEFRVVKQ